MMPPETDDSLVLGSGEGGKYTAWHLARAGELKALVGTDDRILGFTALGPRAGELLPAVQLAIAHGLPFTAVRNLVIAHPTYAEVTLIGAVPA